MVRSKAILPEKRKLEAQTRTKFVVRIRPVTPAVGATAVEDTSSRFRSSARPSFSTLLLRGALCVRVGKKDVEVVWHPFSITEAAASKWLFCMVLVAQSQPVQIKSLGVLYHFPCWTGKRNAFL